MSAIDQPICLTFAGPYGCSKSPIAQYLSCEFGWPIFANDIVRSEIKEDLLENTTDPEALRLRAAPRIEAMIARGQSFIADMSQDRYWKQFLGHFAAKSINYRIGVISIDLSEVFYRKLLSAKDYNLSEDMISSYLIDHKRTAVEDEFVICHITDDTFSKRLQIAASAVRDMQA